MPAARASARGIASSARPRPMLNHASARAGARIGPSGVFGRILDNGCWVVLLMLVLIGSPSRCALRYSPWERPGGSWLHDDLDAAVLLVAKGPEHLGPVLEP